MGKLTKLIVLNIFILYSFHIYSAAKEIKSPIEIRNISPKVAPVGSEVEIRFSLLLSPDESMQFYQYEKSKREDRVFVFFGDIPTEIVSIEKNKLRVVVPPRLLAGSMPSVIIEYGRFRSAPFRDFKVAPFEIKKIWPNPAEAGSEVEIEVSKRIDAGNLSVTFNKLPTEILKVTLNTILVKVPDGLKAGSDPVVFVFLDEDRSEIFDDFSVKVPLLNKLLNPNFILGFSIPLILIIILIIRSRRRLGAKIQDTQIELLKAAELRDGLITEEDEESRLPQPEPPDDLVRDCLEGKCVLYIGAGLSAQAGFPTWKPFVRNLLNWTIEENIVEKEFGLSLHSALDKNDTDLVADSIVSAVKEKNQNEKMNDYLRNIFVSASQQPPKLYRLLKDIGCFAVLTTNFDTLLEDTFRGEKFSVFTPMDTEALLDTLPNQEQFILKLYGNLDKPETLLIAPAQYEAAIAGNKPFSAFMQSLFYARTILFLGASLEGIEAYLEGIKFREHSSTPHFALVSITGSAWKAKADLLLRRYGIKVLPYTLSAEHPEVIEFSKLLIQAIKTKKRKDEEPQKTLIDKKMRKPKYLQRVYIENIGPFDSLDLKLDSQWNILLGDNGVGKSTILKAIAIGICGDASSPYADRLIKIGKKVARITLETSDRKEYFTEIHRMNGKAEVKSLPNFPLRTERWLALGFPPMRSISWERMRGPQPEEGKRRFTSEDLLPLIRDEYDLRLDKLKQWIVNIDYRIKDEKLKKVKESRYEKLFQEFFRIVDNLTEGITIQFKEIDPASKRVKIITDDGVVPIESVSQGTTSLIGWIGILLQRLYEIYGNEDHPRNQYALVLIDEVDAHMHPAWQQSLLPKLQKIFPNVQFIATTHSPLIVGGMPAEQVFKFVRDKSSKVVKAEIESDMTMGRADQILTGHLFGLESTLDRKGTELEIERYQQLLKQKSLTEEEKKELLKIQQNLDLRMPIPKETPLERRAHELLKTLLEVEVGEQFPEAKQKILKKAEQLFSELQAKQKQKK